jgi:hypothetical protein
MGSDTKEPIYHGLSPVPMASILISILFPEQIRTSFQEVALTFSDEQPTTWYKIRDSVPQGN